MKIGFIGLGNMATAIIGGLLREDTTLSSEDGNVTVITAANIIGSAKTEATRQKRAEQFGIAVTASNREVAEAADVLVLAVKPQFFPEVIAEIRDAVSENTLVISIAAGLTLERIAGLFDRDVTAMRLIRCMAEHPGPRERRVHRRRTGARGDGGRRSSLPTAHGKLRPGHRHSRTADGCRKRHGRLLPRLRLHVHRGPGRWRRGRRDAPRASVRIRRGRPSPDRPNSCWKPDAIRAT